MKVRGNGYAGDISLDDLSVSTTPCGGTNIFDF
jgi:hypothetical protein